MNSASGKNPERAKKTKPTGADGHRKRMFDKFLKSGGANFTDRDIIEMLLFFTNRIRDTRGIAVDLLEAFEHDIDSILSTEPRELQKIDGIGGTAASLLGIVGELSTRLDDSLSPFSKSGTDISEIGKLFEGRHFCHKHDETWAAFFDNDMRPVAFEKIKNDRLMPQDSDYIFSAVTLASTLRSKTVAVARFSGDFTCYPSKADFDAARQTDRIFKASGILLKEYFIVTPDESLGITKMCI